VVVGDEQLDPLAGESPAQADVAEPAQVADGDVAGLADPVLADPEVS
jgi:hypothetical protein